MNGIDEAETAYLESFINDPGTDGKLRSTKPARSDGENREAAVESNSCRDALRNVYPLEWLWY